MDLTEATVRQAADAGRTLLTVPAADELRARRIVCAGVRPTGDTLIEVPPPVEGVRLVVDPSATEPSMVPPTTAG